MSGKRCKQAKREGLVIESQAAEVDQRPMVCRLMRNTEATDISNVIVILFNSSFIDYTFCFCYLFA